ncbi:MAG TPA: histidine kinase dimerization/phospho-acceptor domain-containing protein [Croceibacterium sp.]|nr:histidine kinase dimerization/phospho-acceptor domain-containing protein [Croceibacterium sp.]
MQFDDRLATVLRVPAQSEAAARTQYRQLLDLLGSMPADAEGVLVEAAYERLGELADTLPPALQSAILRAPGLRLRNAALASWLSTRDPQAAAAAMATAQLEEGEWLNLIPRLSMTARGFLRHRRDLPFAAQQVLERLGVRDLVLPEPEAWLEGTDHRPELEAGAPVAEEQAPEAEAGIGALVRRIEAFQRARREAASAPRLPLGDVRPETDFADAGNRRGAFDFATDPQGAIIWADPAMAPLAVGLRLGATGHGSTGLADAWATRALSLRQPLRGARITLSGPAEIAGDWRIDAVPAFSPVGGAFDGYRGRMRRFDSRPSAAAVAAGADRMRQLLHELRTPVGAIQGFAELIQQQMFGPAPNEYRALAAGIAVDAARLLAGFDEIDRLARLESGSMQLDEGRCDLRDVAGQLLRRLEGALRPRSARIDLAIRGGPFTLALDEREAQQLLWRLLATLAGTLGPGEVIDLTLESDGRRATLSADLPTALLDNDDLFAASATVQPRTVSAGMFGSGFSLRLARAEAVAAGGKMEQRGELLCLDLPVLAYPAPSEEGEQHDLPGKFA